MFKILIVDDDPDLLSVVKRLLEKHGYLVAALALSITLHETIAVFCPDLILLDVHLGDADGRQLCSEIKSIQKSAHLPVILYSGDQYPALSISQCKADAFFAKPFIREHLLLKIAELIAA